MYDFRIFFKKKMLAIFLFFFFLFCILILVPFFFFGCQIFLDKIPNQTSYIIMAIKVGKISAPLLESAL